jgi:hypothetical protein
MIARYVQSAQYLQLANFITQEVVGSAVWVVRFTQNDVGLPSFVIYFVLSSDDMYTR